MAKILAVSSDIDSKEDTYQGCFNLIEAIDVFTKFGNQRAVGICYQNLGCLTAKLDRDEYVRALGYIDTAIKIQRDLLEQSEIYANVEQ
jgi:hypothetical protein